MVHCRVDGREHAVTAREMDELATVIDALNSDISKAGCFIASLRVDGRELEPGAEWYRPRKLSGIRSIDVTTGCTSQLAAEALGQGERQLDELRGLLGQTVGLFRSGSDQRAMKLFIDLISGFEWFVTMIRSVGDMLQVDFTTTCMDGNTLAGEVDAMNRILLDIIGAQERRDWVLLGDLLEYELEPQMERWRKLPGVLRELRPS